MYSEDEKLASEDFLQLIHELPGNICWKDRQSRYIRCNETFAEMAHLEHPSQVEGKTDYDLFDRDTADMLRANDAWVITKGKSRNFFESAIDHTGKQCTFYSQKRPTFNKQGEVTGLVVSAVDITETMERLDMLEEEADHKSEYINTMAYLHRFAQWFPGNVFWKDLHGVYLGCNDNQRQFFSHVTPDITGKTLFDFLPLDLAQAIHNTDQDVMRTGQGRLVQETVMNSNGKESIWISSKAPIPDENGNIIGLLGISIDITDRISLEQSLKVALDEADTANRARTEFIMNMSHDLRTPFVGILGFIDALLRTDQTAENREMLNYVKTSSQRLLNIINELIELASSHLPQSQQQIQLSLPELFTELQDIMTPPALTKGLEFSVQLADNVPQDVTLNKHAINRLLFNLVGNAIKFTESGFVKVSCDCLPQDDKQTSMLRFIVEDSGIGIPANQHEQIFDKFARTDMTKQRFEGSGLGLYFVKLLVDELGGKIYADQAKQGGAKFVCEIPFLGE